MKDKKKIFVGPTRLIEPYMERGKTSNMHDFVAAPVKFDPNYRNMVPSLMEAVDGMMELSKTLSETSNVLSE